MPRKLRKKSNTGIYHVMLRGINKQNIFFNEEDFKRMMTILHDIQYIKDEATGTVSSDRCSIYAYCILNNHLHILIRENKQPIADIMKIIEVSYVMYYNKKYQRVGHLFQGRFESESVDDDAYFHTVFRYIALNPVKAMESPTAEEYPYSSWNEYVCHKSNVMKVLKPSCIQAVLRKYPLQDLKEWINQYNEDKCLDMDKFYSVRSDEEAWDILSDSCGMENPEDFRTLDPQTQIYYLLDAIEHGVNIAQAARLGTLTRYQIQKAYNKKVGITSNLGSDPNYEEKLEQSHGVDSNAGHSDIEGIQQKVREIVGQGKKTYHQLHLIVEYLYKHSEARCNEIAQAIGACDERARQYLILLANENIIEISGAKRNRTYKLAR